MRMLSSHTTQKYPHGTIINDGGSNCIGVASFNLLAPLYIRPIDQRTGEVQPFASFDWISEEDSERILGNDHRLPKLLQRMLSCGCDFICVQELQLEREGENNDIQEQRVSRGKRSRKEDGGDDDTNTQEFVLPNWIRPMIQPASSSNTIGPYSIILPPQNELEKIAERNRRVLLADAAITNAIFYQSDKWSPISASGTEGNVSANSTTTLVTQAFLPVVGGQDESEPVVITSIHLDACSEEKRVQQMQRCLEQSLSYSGTPYIPPFIIAGDYNCELFEGSCMNAFLSRGDIDLNSTEQSTAPIDAHNNSQCRRKECATALRLPSGTLPSVDQIQSWDELHDAVTKYKHDRFVSLKRIESGCTRVAYDHDEDPSTIIPNQSRSMAQWHLDHILFTPSTLAPIGYWATLEDDAHSSAVGLPNDNIPTDHLPIAALFERHVHPQLSKDAKDSLLQSLLDLEKRHEIELKTKNEEVKQKRAELEEQHMPKKVEELAENKPSKKSKKKKKGPPPPEIVDHIRSSRAMIKQVKAEHQEERQLHINEKTILERMVIQHLLGGDLTCAQWIERGRGNC